MTNYFNITTIIFYFMTILTIISVWAPEFYPNINYNYLTSVCSRFFTYLQFPHKLNQLFSIIFDKPLVIYKEDKKSSNFLNSFSKILSLMSPLKTVNDFILLFFFIFLFYSKVLLSNPVVSYKDSLNPLDINTFNVLKQQIFFVSDKYVLISSILIIFLTYCIIRLSTKFVLSLNLEVKELPYFMGFSLGFLLLFIASKNFISLFLCLEGISFILYILSAINFRSFASIEAAIKYFCLGGIASGIMLYGISLVYALTGTLDYWYLKSFMVSFNAYPLVSINFSIALILFGFFFKMSVFPCHIWAPDVYDGAPLIITAFFGIVVKLAVFLVFIRLYAYILYMLDFVNQMLLISAFGSLIFGSFGALYTHRIKRFVAFGSINQAGFLLIGLGCSSFNGLCATMFHLINYVLMGLGLFTFLIALEFVTPNLKSTGLKESKLDSDQLRFLSDLNGYGKLYPKMSIHFTIILFSMAGIPPLLGFFSKFFILFSGWEANKYFLVLFALFINVLSTYYYIRIIYRLWAIKLKNVNYNYFQASSSKEYIKPILDQLIFISFFLTFAWLAIYPICSWVRIYAYCSIHIGSH